MSNPLDQLTGAPKRPTPESMPTPTPAPERAADTAEATSKPASKK